MERLAEKNEFFRLDRGLAGLGGEAFTLHPDEIADVEKPVNRHPFLTERLVLQINLHTSAVVTHVEKMALAHVPPRGDPAGQGNFAPFDKAGPHIADVAGHGESRPVSGHAAAQ